MHPMSSSALRRIRLPALFGIALAVVGISQGQAQESRMFVIPAATVMASRSVSTPAADAARRSRTPGAMRTARASRWSSVDTGPTSPAPPTRRGPLQNGTMSIVRRLSLADDDERGNNRSSPRRRKVGTLAGKRIDGVPTNDARRLGPTPGVCFCAARTTALPGWRWGGVPPPLML